MSKSLMRRTALALTLAAGLVAAGCGGDDDDGGDVESGASPAEVVTSFYAATADQDVDTLCALITEETAQQAADEEDADSCEESAEKGLADDETTSIAESVEVGEETIDGDAATVEVTSEEAGGTGEINLVQEDGEWRIDFAE